MNRLLLQFILISIIPLSFLGLLIYTWRKRPARRNLAVWWSITLVGFGLWASRLLTNYLGADFSAAVSFNWRIVSQHILSLTGTLLLATTTVYLFQTVKYRPWRYLPGLVLWLLAITLDPALWHALYTIPDFTISGLIVRQFDIWAIVWVASWVVPTLIAWVNSEQATRDLPKSLYRSQATYWLVVMTVIGLAGLPALARGSLVAEQIGAMLLFIASLLASVAVTRHQLVDLQNRLQRYLLTFVRGIVIFLLAWGALALLTVFLTETSALVVAAAIFAILILLWLAIVDKATRQIWHQPPDEEAVRLGEQLEGTSGLINPNDFVDQLMQQLQNRILNEGCWFMETAEAPGGRLILRPLAKDQTLLQPVVFSEDSPFVHYLRQETRPLAHQDVEANSLFADIPAAEREVIDSWQRQLYVPVRAGSRLVGMIGMQAKSSTDPYVEQDFLLLEGFAARAGQLFAQIRNLHALGRVNSYVFTQNQLLAREKRRLDELVQLHGQFTALMSPELRRPFTNLELEIQKMQPETNSDASSQNGQGSAPSSPSEIIRQQADEAQAMVDNLIAVASHLEKQRQFHLVPLHIDSVLRTVIRNLEGMIEARRVVVLFDVRGKLLPVYGDGERLTEAIQQVVHNAVKFNRIGGEVRITCEMRRNEVRIQVSDNGVGIPEDKLPELWTGLTKLFGNDQGLRRRTRVGLPLVRFIVQSHGGRVEAESDYGHGSIFTIYLPAYLESEEQAQ